MTNHPLKTICSVLRVSRATAYRQSKPRAHFYARAEDELVLEQIQAVTKRRATYGHRRVGARVNRLFGVHYNRKRVRRVMRIHEVQIPAKSRRRTGRAHTGRIATQQSNVRWCSDAFEIACWGD
jgi:putative transposase